MYAERQVDALRSEAEIVLPVINMVTEKQYSIFFEVLKLSLSLFLSL